MNIGSKKNVFPAAFAAVLLSSCASSSFLAVSSDRGPAGGVYEIKNGKAGQIAVLPSMYHLVRDPRAENRYYGTFIQNPASSERKERTGAAAVLERTSGNVLQPVQIRPVGGQTPCFAALSPDGGFLYTANYSSGDVSELPLYRGRISGPPRLIRQTGQGVTRRQKSPHPHCVLFDPAGKQLYVCDLGTDQIWIYRWSPEKGVELPCAGKLKLPPGSGPRHLVFDPSGLVLYTANELNSTAASFVRDSLQSEWKPGPVRSTLPEGVSGAKNYPGAIKITADGRFFFVTNRGHDSIAVFEASRSGDFKLLRTVPSGGKYPGDLLLLNGETQAVVHYREGGVTLFDLDPATGNLTPKAGRVPVPRGLALCE